VPLEPVFVHCTKTGSAQTYGNLKNGVVFLRHGHYDWEELTPLLQSLVGGGPQLKKELVIRDAIRGVSLIMHPFEALDDLGRRSTTYSRGRLRLSEGAVSAVDGNGTLLPRLAELLRNCWAAPAGAQYELHVRASLVPAPTAGADCQITYVLEAAVSCADEVTRTFGGFVPAREQARRSEAKPNAAGNIRSGGGGGLPAAFQ
jgi:hypothetical protein